MAMTKPKLLEALKELGVEADDKKTNAQLTAQLKKAQKDKEKADKADDKISDDPEKIDGDEDKPDEEAKPEEGEDDEDKIVDEEEEEKPKAKKDKEEEGDYLRKYQYKKQCKNGSPDTDPAKGSDAERMKEHLLKDDKVKVFIPRAEKEDPQITLSVTLNGYRLDLPKNTYITLPKGVVDVIMDSLQQNEEAIMRGQIVAGSDKDKKLQ